MRKKNSPMIWIGLPSFGVLVTVTSYAFMMWLGAQTVSDYVKPGGKATAELNQTTVALHQKYMLSQSQMQVLGTKYQNLLNQARQDQALIIKVNNQLSSQGLSTIPNVPTSFPIVKGYATQVAQATQAPISSPPAVQTVTSAS